MFDTVQHCLILMFNIVWYCSTLLDTNQHSLILFSIFGYYSTLLDSILYVIIHDESWGGKGNSWYIATGFFIQYIYILILMTCQITIVKYKYIVIKWTIPLFSFLHSVFKILSLFNNKNNYIICNNLKGSIQNKRREGRKELWLEWDIKGGRRSSVVERSFTRSWRWVFK